MDHSKKEIAKDLERSLRHICQNTRYVENGVKVSDPEWDMARLMDSFHIVALYGAEEVKAKACADVRECFDFYQNDQHDTRSPLAKFDRLTEVFALWPDTLKALAQYSEFAKIVGDALVKRFEVCGKLDFFDKPKGVTNLLVGALSVVSVSGQDNVDAFLSLVDKRLDVKDLPSLERKLSNVGFTTKDPKEYATKTHEWNKDKRIIEERKVVENTLYSFTRLWAQSMQTGYSGDVYEKKFDELIGTLSEIYPERTAQIVKKIAHKSPYRIAAVDQQALRIILGEYSPSVMKNDVSLKPGQN